MNPTDRKKAAKDFANAWSGKGYEKGDAQVFWMELLRDVVGMKRVSSEVKFEYRTSDGGFIDCWIPDTGVLIEQKGISVDLDKPEERQGRMVTPLEQALAYAESFPRNRQPRFIVVCNFSTFRVHDRDKFSRKELGSNYLQFSLEELGDNPHLLDFIIDPANSRSEREKQVSMDAGRLIGELYSMLREQYIDPDSPESAHALNVLCVRLVFCLFCEDADLFPKDAFLNYLKKIEPLNIRNALKNLFKALNTPIAERDPYDESIKIFPYVNGGLFAEETEIPNFTEEIKFKLLFDVSQQTDWSKISPTIFGGIFESTLNPETRRAGGMHYTSPENIHKVIDPLFLDDLRDELETIKADKSVKPGTRKNRLIKFRKKIAELKFLDPACGSGNFLTETYLSLRSLEDDALNEINYGQSEIRFGEEEAKEVDEKRVSLSQFYGIEINDFAVRVARVALWIAQLQANNESEMLFDLGIEDFPLKDTANIVEGNALRLDWNEILPADECSYIMGNPPFIGQAMQSREQSDDVTALFNGKSGYGKLDYVAGWFKKAADYSSKSATPFAFVASNSICQGESVSLLWRDLLSTCHEIIYAYTTFKWNNEADRQAAVMCVIVGVGKKGSKKIKTIYSDYGVSKVEHINGYLKAAPDVYIKNRKKTINRASCIVTQGSQPMEDGQLLFKTKEKEEFLKKYPECNSYFRPFVGAREFLNDTSFSRWCLWLLDVDPMEYKDNSEIMKRIAHIREYRQSNKIPRIRKTADKPQLFTQIRQPKTDYLLIPRVSSEKRKYIPIGYVSPYVVASDATVIITNATLFDFGLLSSIVHNSWMRQVAGRLKSDYRYAPSVYYNFPYPQAISDELKNQVSSAAEKVLEARKCYPTATMAELYDPENEWMFSELAKAHKALDKAVEEAYGVDFNGDEEKIVAHLFKLYAEMTKGE